MATNRRDLLKAGSALLAGVSLAGCGGRLEEGTSTTTSRVTVTTDAEETTTTGGDPPSAAELAVAAEWNVYRAMAHDALALGLAGEFDAAATVAGDTFEKFEKASGEWGAHEALESTGKEYYEEFEEALGQLRERAGGENVEEMRVETGLVSEHLSAAQTARAGTANAHALDLLALGSRASTAAALAGAEKFDAAATVAGDAYAAFEEADAHAALEEADGESYDAFETALEDAQKAAKNGRPKRVREQASAALDAAATGAYAVADGEEAAGAGYIAAMQARGYDAGALSSLGGPSTDFAHAAALNVYRARAYDAAWLTARGRSDRAKAVAQDTFAHFEGAKSHEALEEADGEAYKGFEAGLKDLASAAGNGDAEAARKAADAVERHLRAGISALATPTEAAMLQAAFFRARFGDARELYALGDGAAAASVAQGLFERFEKDHLGFHEALESASEDLYEGFEHEHLQKGLIPAFESGNDEEVETHFAGVNDALFEFETKVGSTARVSAAESGLMSARVFDAAALSALGRSSRARSVVQSAFQHFEEGAGGFHEALEGADRELYESFESRLNAVGGAASGSGDAYARAKEFDADAVAGIYAVVANAGGDFGGAAASVARDAFAGFEEARVHEMLEEADRETYESFESKLNELVGALDDGTGVSGALGAFARASVRAEFAVAGAPEKAPVGEGGGESGGESEKQLEGGPNVVTGVPDDADHVVDMTAVAFEPAELTVKKGDTVAFEHVGGEPHSVTADDEKIPDGADYWASGGFDSQEKAVKGWESGRGAVQSGQSYVHTFETKGTHEYYCIPHEAAGMVGTIVVE
ncbi:DUF5059 domain-containing protein [Halorussus salinus]|uniref:DUF5059 domain-containing protein n=1 Tax=Halorussus salinus TaxID=1364935 RepID=UPI001092CF51|nr:DUF5059 domain-containing protein [Halorussus salinus]